MSGQIEAILPGIWTTILLTVLAFTAGAIIALPIVAMRRSKSRLVQGLVRTVVDLIRCVPPITWLFLIYFGLPQFDVEVEAFPTAVIVLGIVSGAYLSEAYRSGLLAVSQGQWEAASALGLGRLDTAARVIAPQAIRVIIPPAATYAIGLLKDTSVASAIGVTEVTQRATAHAAANGDTFQILIIAGVVYLLLSLPLAYVSRGMDRRLRLRYSLA